MGYRTPSNANQVLQNAAFPVNTETVALLSQPMNTPLDNPQVIIICSALYTSGSTAVTLTARLRRGTTTAGVLINVNSAITTVANANGWITFTYSDLPGTVAGLQYVFTLNPPAGGTAGTLLDGSIVTMVL